MIQETKFLALIAPGKNGLQFGSDESRVMLDMPETEVAGAMKLQLCRRSVLRITVEWDDADVSGKIFEGSGVIKQKGKKQEDKGPFGHFWERMVVMDFPQWPGVKEVLERERKPEHRDAWDTVRHLFRVKSRTDISPDAVKAYFPGEQIKIKVDRAIEKATEAQNDNARS